MGNNFTIEYDETSRIKKLVLHGTISKEEYIRILSELKTNKPEQHNSFILEDTRKADLLYHPSEISDIKRHLIDFSSGFNIVKIASITDNPKNTVFSTLLSKNVNLKNFHHEVFSTEEYALKWLKEDIL